MGITKGLIDQDHRYDSISQSYILERVDAPGEEHTAELLQGLGGRCGFILNEIPVLNTLEPTIVTRINIDESEDEFEETNIAPTSLQFKINYTQEDSIVYLPVSEVGNSFRVQYSCKGSGQHVKNIKALVNLTMQSNSGLSGMFKRSLTHDKILNSANLYLLGNRATYRNFLSQGSNMVRGNVAGKTSFVEVYSDFTIERGSEFKKSGVILIIHGNMSVSGSGAAPIISALDAVEGEDGLPGGSSILGGDPIGGNGGNASKILEMPLGIGKGGGAGGGGSGNGGTVSGNGGDGFNGGNGGNASTGSGATLGTGGLADSGGVDGDDGIFETPNPSHAYSGGDGADGADGNLLWGAGANGQDGEDSFETIIPTYVGGSGGKGGASGGAGIFIICFGDIDPEIEFITGKGIDGSQSGPFTLISKYSSLPNTIDVTAGVDGVDGDINFLSFSNRSDLNESILAEYGFFTAGSINI